MKCRPGCLAESGESFLAVTVTRLDPFDDSSDRLGLLRRKFYHLILHWQLELEGRPIVRSHRDVNHRDVLKLRPPDCHCDSKRDRHSNTLTRTQLELATVIAAAAVAPRPAWVTVR